MHGRDRLLVHTLAHLTPMVSFAVRAVRPGHRLRATTLLAGNLTPQSRAQWHVRTQTRTFAEDQLALSVGIIILTGGHKSLVVIIGQRVIRVQVGHVERSTLPVATLLLLLLELQLLQRGVWFVPVEQTIAIARVEVFVEKVTRARRPRPHVAVVVDHPGHHIRLTTLGGIQLEQFVLSLLGFVIVLALLLVIMWNAQSRSKQGQD